MRRKPRISEGKLGKSIRCMYDTTFSWSLSPCKGAAIVDTVHCQFVVHFHCTPCKKSLNMYYRLCLAISSIKLEKVGGTNEISWSPDGAFVAVFLCTITIYRMVVTCRHFYWALR